MLQPRSSRCSRGGAGPRAPVENGGPRLVNAGLNDACQVLAGGCKGLLTGLQHACHNAMSACMPCSAWHAHRQSPSSSAGMPCNAWPCNVMVQCSALLHSSAVLRWISSAEVDGQSVHKCGPGHVASPSIAYLLPVLHAAQSGPIWVLFNRATLCARQVGSCLRSSKYICMAGGLAGSMIWTSFCSRLLLWSHLPEHRVAEAAREKQGRPGAKVLAHDSAAVAAAAMAQARRQHLQPNTPTSGLVYRPSPI
jgi:hypothetical protein